MTNSQLTRIPARYLLETLIDSHGFWHVVRELLAANAGVRRYKKGVIDDGTPEYLRRDMGLPPKAPPPYYDPTKSLW